MIGRSKALAVAALVALVATLATPSVAQATPSPARVLQVGTVRGIRGAYSTIQSAVDAARPGDWILIGAGDYKEQGAAGDGVLITTPSIHLRGVDRNGVVVDGTKAGYPECSADPAAQDFGPGGAGRNGIEVRKVDGVTIDNLTVCNFLSSASGSNGNQIWWNGGDGSGRIGLGSYHGAYLTATSTWFDPKVANAGQYGIFVSNAKGPGTIERSYASNMADSSFYVGACGDCNAVLDGVHGQNSALGYSGTNAGGHLVIENSEWDTNRSGIVPSSLANDDPPSPQDGACPGQPTRSCTLIEHNYVHDNNNPNTPAIGLTAGAVIGTGIDLTGDRNDTVRNNLVVNNGSWGILVNDYPDPSLPATPTWCQGGTPFFNPPAPIDQILGPVIPCYFDATGNHIEANVLARNGTFGNPTNGDLANAALAAPVGNCFRANIDLATGRPSSAPGNLQDPSVAGRCGQPWSPNLDQVAPLLLQALCAAFGPASGACGAGPGYPQPTQVRLLPIPRERGMGNPCDALPANSWCRHSG